MLRLLASLVLFAAMPASAQIAVLPYGGYDLDVSSPLYGLGVEIGVPVAAPVDVSVRLSGESVVSKDFTRVSDGRLFTEEVLQGNLELVGTLGAGALRPYAGIGLAVTSFKLDTADDDDVEGDQDLEGTDVSANAVAGAMLGGFGPVAPFVQARGTLGGRTAGAVMGGIRLGF